jgi:hypothetical protein
MPRRSSRILRTKFMTLLQGDRGEGSCKARGDPSGDPSRPGVPMHLLPGEIQASSQGASSLARRCPVSIARRPSAGTDSGIQRRGRGTLREMRRIEKQVKGAYNALAALPGGNAHAVLPELLDDSPAWLYQGGRRKQQASWPMTEPGSPCKTAARAWRSQGRSSRASSATQVVHRPNSTCKSNGVPTS